MTIDGKGNLMNRMSPEELQLILSAQELAKTVQDYLDEKTNSYVKLVTSLQSFRVAENLLDKAYARELLEMEEQSLQAAPSKKKKIIYN